MNTHTWETLSVEAHTLRYFDNATRQDFELLSGDYNGHQQGLIIAGFNESKGYFATGDVFYVGCRSGYTLRAGQAEADEVGPIEVSNAVDDAKAGTSDTGSYMTE
jgi:hypothetical protein